MCVYVCVKVRMFVKMNIWRERERERERDMKKNTYKLISSVREPTACHLCACVCVYVVYVCEYGACRCV